MKGMVLGAVFLSACWVYADADGLYRQGAKLFKSDPAQACELFVQAAEAGQVSAMVGAGHCFENGIGTSVNYANALSYYDKAARYRSQKACEGLARIYASCPDPQFHDGEKAVKFASALVKKPLDVNYLDLLAAAHARNFDFETASVYLEKSLRLKRMPEDIRQQRVGRVRAGLPIPACTTDDWIEKAIEQNAGWAIRQMAWKCSDSQHPLYDPEKAIALCDLAIANGDAELNALKGDILLRDAKEDSDLDEVIQCYENIPASYLNAKGIKRPVQHRARRYLKSSGDVCWKSSEKYKTGFKSEYAHDVADDGIVGQYREYHQPADKELSQFLAYLADLKGVPEAEGAWSQKIARNWNRRCGAYFELRYRENPQAKAALEAGQTYLNLGEIELAVFWLEQALSMEIESATRKLVEIYACGDHPALYDGETAVAYAEAMVEKNSNPDHKLLTLLACAYARNGTFMKVTSTMQDAIKITKTYRYGEMLKAFKKNRAWPAKL